MPKDDPEQLNTLCGDALGIELSSVFDVSSAIVMPSGSKCLFDSDRLIWGDVSSKIEPINSFPRKHVSGGFSIV
ncbi:MAG: hypothetical protein H6844_19230 [Alphaproteobacteria bacterium]|nr:hypothetical protein [Alphaproteobacteria bacterium]